MRPTLDLPGVGRNLHDQPCVEVCYEGSGELIEEMERHQAEIGWRPHEQVIAKFPSAGCEQGFDLHIYPVGGYSEGTVGMVVVPGRRVPGATVARQRAVERSRS